MKIGMAMIGAAALLVLGTGAGAGLHAWQQHRVEAAAVQALQLSQPLALSAFAVTDQQGARFGLEQLRGRWSLLFFGYTHCPDVCTPTLRELARTRATPCRWCSSRWITTATPPHGSPSTWPASLNPD